MTSAASTRRILIASLVGTTVEFYDFYIYATAAALVFGPLFFPAESASVQLLSSYASLAVAFIARPVGAYVFGHYGDRIGRKSTLVASLMLMGGSTLAIAFLPVYATIGWWAPLLLCVLRFGQGFGLGGEWGGAALLAVENAPPGWRGRYGMVPQVLPGFLSYALLRFEINVRSSTIIGFVGAGGIGQELRRVIGFNIYEEVSAICLLILVIVVAIDLLSERIRHRFIGNLGGTP